MAVAEFEAVCAALQSSDATARGQADEWLQQLRTPGRDASLAAVGRCKEVLQHSAVAAAQFHAVMAVRDILMREWDALPAEFRAGIRQEMLEYTVGRCGGGALEPFVQQQLLQVGDLPDFRHSLSVCRCRPRTFSRAAFSLSRQACSDSALLPQFPHAAGGPGLQTHVAG
eukprot:SAG22_NODE_181_length_16048_cov_157.464418_26_plen_170_part_00